MARGELPHGQRAASAPEHLRSALQQEQWLHDVNAEVNLKKSFVFQEPFLRSPARCFRRFRPCIGSSSRYHYLTIDPKVPQNNLLRRPRRLLCNQGSCLLSQRTLVHPSASAFNKLVLSGSTNTIAPIETHYSSPTSIYGSLPPAPPLFSISLPQPPLSNHASPIPPPDHLHLHPPHNRKNPIQPRQGHPQLPRPSPSPSSPSD
jgi:hypothetical protein